MVPPINDAGIVAVYSVEVYVLLSCPYVAAAVLSPAEVVETEINSSKTTY